MRVAACVRQCTCTQSISSHFGLPKKEGVGLCEDQESISDSCFTKPSNMANQSSDSATPPRQAPKISFRVLIIGRANAGKTSILQRICDTTESPVIYQRTYNNDKSYHEKEVSILSFV